MLWYEEIGELVRACDKPWFAQTLQSSLQAIMDYDYFLMAHYRKGMPIQVIRCDFPEAQIDEALALLCQHTYIAEPIYRLHNEQELPDGVYDMEDLARRCGTLPTSVKKSLSDLIEDEGEQIGHRTRGWPEYLQETCLIFHADNENLVAISLYNCGLANSNAVSRESLTLIFPALISIMRRFFRSKSYKQELLEDGKTKNKNISSQQVIAFFAQSFSVSLTAREADIFSYLLQGMTIAAVAEELCISVHTAKTHRRNVYRKIGHGHQLELIRKFHLFLRTD